MYFQEYARLIFENADNKDVKEGGNEYRQILELPSNEENITSASSELELDSLNKNDNNITIKTVHSMDEIKCSRKVEEGNGGREVENYQDIIPLHQWQHFEPFFKWLDNPTKLPEVRFIRRLVYHITYYLLFYLFFFIYSYFN